MLKFSKKWINIIKRGLLITGLALIAIGLVISLTFNVILAPCIQSNFFLKTSPEFTVFGNELEFDCMLFEPKPEYNIYEDNRPALVMVHGFISSKVFFRGMAYELNKRGIVCLLITANGHAASDGGFTPTWENITLSAVKYLRDYNETLKIDTNRIGLVGHSMGSFSVTVSSIMDQELGNFWINSTVGIGGPFLNISRGFGPGFSLILRNPYIYPNVWYDAEEAIENAVIEGRTNLTRPYNYMNIIGDKDEAFSLRSAYELVYGMSTPEFWTKQGVNNQNEIISGQLYGDYNGTARKLYVLPGIDHLFEASLKSSCIAVIDWFEESMNLKSETNYQPLNPNTITEEIMLSAMVWLILGTIILFIPMTVYLGNLFKTKENKLPENARKVEKKKMWQMFLIYGVTFIGISFLTTPIIHGLGLINLIPTDFLISNILSLGILVQGLLMIPFLIIITIFEKRKYNMKLNDFGIQLGVKSNIKNTMYGILLLSTLFIGLNLALTTSMHNVFIWRIFSFLQLFMYLFIGLIIFEVMFRGMIQNKLSRYRHGSLMFIPAPKELFFSSVISGIIEGFGLGVIVTGILWVGGMDVFSADMGGMIPQDMGISFGAIPPLFLIIPVIFIILEVVLGFLKSWIFRKSNNNIIASALFVALFLAWILSVIMPATAMYAPRFVFMT